jgi:hypothetical protein
LNDIELSHAVSNLSASDPLYFGRTIAPKYLSMKPAAFQRILMKEIISLPKHIQILCVSIPRGFAKTMLASTIYPLWGAIMKKWGYVLIGSYSDVKAMQILESMKDIVEGEDFQDFYGSVKGPKWSEHTLTLESAKFNVDCQIMSRGRGSQIAGLRYKEHRPILFIGDDLENPEEVYNQDIVDRNERWLLEVVQPGLAPGGKMILIGTPFAYDSTLSRFTNPLKRGVKLIRFPALVDEEETSRRLDIPMDHSIWEERFPTEELRRKREEHQANGTLDIFDRQFQLNPYPPGSVAFKDPQYYEMDDIKDKLLYTYMTVDLSYKKGRQNDRTGIVVCSWDQYDDCYVREVMDGKWGDMDSLKKVVEIAQRYPELKKIGIESYAFGFAESEMRKLLRENGLTVSVEELKPAGRVKEDRIRQMIKYSEQGKWFVKQDQQRLINQSKRFHGQQMKEDGLLDAWSYQLDIRSKPIDNVKTIEDKKQQAWDRFEKNLRASIVRDNREKSRINPLRRHVGAIQVQDGDY